MAEPTTEATEFAKRVELLAQEFGYDVMFSFGHFRDEKMEVDSYVFVRRPATDELLDLVRTVGEGETEEYCLRRHAQAVLVMLLQTLMDLITLKHPEVLTILALNRMEQMQKMMDAMKEAADEIGGDEGEAEPERPGGDE